MISRLRGKHSINILTNNRIGIINSYTGDHIAVDDLGGLGTLDNIGGYAGFTVGSGFTDVHTGTLHFNPQLLAQVIFRHFQIGRNFAGKSLAVSIPLVGSAGIGRSNIRPDPIAGFRRSVVQGNSSDDVGNHALGDVAHGTHIAVGAGHG